MMCREIARPSPVPVRRVVKYGVEDPRQILCSNADAAIPDLDGDPVGAEPERLQTDRVGRRRLRSGP